MQKIKKTVHSVSSLVSKIKSILKNEEIKNICVRGEISNLSRSDAGHIYFSLKDNLSLLRCAFFSFKNQFFDLNFLQDGLEVDVFGSISVFEKGGYFNLNVTKITELGKGNIYQKIENLKKQLYEKGFFEEEHKKEIPQFNFNIGIATSIHGAALRDIIKTAKQRFPAINLLIAPCIVQGENAPDSIINAIQLLNHEKWKLDLIIAGRGGGSFEDLIAFNDKKVALSFFKSRLPIISAVGHQIDSVICDFTADVYCTTPTAAAELSVFDIIHIKNRLEKISQQIRYHLQYKIKAEKQKLAIIYKNQIFSDPLSLLQNSSQILDNICFEIAYSGKQNSYNLKQQLLNIKNFDSYIKISITKLNQKLEQVSSKIDHFIIQNLQKTKGHFKVLSEKIEGYSHKKILALGYTIVKNKKNEIISDSSKISEEEELELIFNKGKIKVISKNNL